MSSRREAWQTVSVRRVLDVVGEFDDSGGASLGPDNPEIDRLDAVGSLLELVEAHPYTVCVYRPPRERSGARRSRSPSWRRLERELAPNLVGLGRYLGLSAKRSVELARLFGVRTADELREAAAEGRLQSVPRIVPKTEAQPLEALAREAAATAPRTSARPAWELVGGIAAALDGEAAGDVRRWRDCCQLLAVVCRAADPIPCRRALSELPQIVATIEQDDRRAVGAILDGVPIELDAAEPNRFVAALVRATGRPRTSQRSSRYLTHPTRRRSTGRSAFPGVRRSCARRGSAANPPALVEPNHIRGDLHCRTIWSDGSRPSELSRSAGLSAPTRCLPRRDSRIDKARQHRGSTVGDGNSLVEVAQPAGSQFALPVGALAMTIYSGPFGVAPDACP